MVARESVDLRRHAGHGPTGTQLRRSIEPPPPAPRIGDGRCNGVRPLQEPSPAREAEWPAGEGASEATPPPLPRGGLASGEEELRHQETINLLALDELVELFAFAHHSG